MTTQLNLTITANTAAEALHQLAEIAFRAAQELGVGPQQEDTEPELPLPEPAAAPAKGNGEDLAAVLASAAPAPAEKRTRGKRAPAEPAEAGPDRTAIVDGLTKLYMAGDPTVRERITAFRDGYGVQRLRELKDEALPEAAKLLTALRQANPEP